MSSIVSFTVALHLTPQSTMPSEAVKVSVMLSQSKTHHQLEMCGFIGAVDYLFRAVKVSVRWQDTPIQCSSLDL